MRRCIELKGRKPRISIIVPALNEGAIIDGLLDSLQPARASGHEVVLVDGGSEDDTRAKAEGKVDLLLQNRAGRARQMNRGARESSGRWLWFLHADSSLPAGWLQQIEAACGSDTGQWGFFAVRLDNPRWPYRVIAWFMNRRSCLTRIATGDQGIFVRRELFFAHNGYADLPLMEDVDLSRRLKEFEPCCLQGPLGTSARRWEEQGILRTVFRMWSLRLAFWLGISPRRLSRHYPQCSSPDTES